MSTYIDKATIDDGNQDFYLLPFSQPLQRSAFNTPTFDPDQYLYSAYRHQTLEDLRSELRQFLSTISDELVDLVNDSSAEFLKVGNTLEGGNKETGDIALGVLEVQTEFKV